MSPQSGSSSIADELTKLAKLREQGVITSSEFEVQKAKLMGIGTKPAVSNHPVSRKGKRDGSNLQIWGVILFVVGFVAGIYVISASDAKLAQEELSRNDAVQGAKVFFVIGLIGAALFVWGLIRRNRLQK